MDMKLFKFHFIYIPSWKNGAHKCMVWFVRERLGKWQACCILCLRMSLVGGRVAIRLSGYSAVVGLGENVGGENNCVNYLWKVWSK